jgi:hypothetical protein
MMCGGESRWCEDDADADVGTQVAPCSAMFTRQRCAAHMPFSNGLCITNSICAPKAWGKGYDTKVAATYVHAGGSAQSARGTRNENEENGELLLEKESTCTVDGRGTKGDTDRWSEQLHGTNWHKKGLFDTTSVQIFGSPALAASRTASQLFNSSSKSHS